MDSVRAPPSLLPRGRRARGVRAPRDAARDRIVDGRTRALGPRCIAESHDGTVPRVRGGPDAARAAARTATSPTCSSRVSGPSSAVSCRGCSRTSAHPSVAPASGISDAVKYSFGVASALLLSAVCWTAFNDAGVSTGDAAAIRRTRREIGHARFAEQDAQPRGDLACGGRRRFRLGKTHGRACGAVRAGVRVSGLWHISFLASRSVRENAFTTILNEMESMSPSMRWLALVQFFSWFSLFAIFVYAAPAVARLHFDATAPGTPAYEAAANSPSRPRASGVIVAARKAVTATTRSTPSLPPCSCKAGSTKTPHCSNPKSRNTRLYLATTRAKPRTHRLGPKKEQP